MRYDKSSLKIVAFCLFSSLCLNGQAQVRDTIDVPRRSGNRRGSSPDYLTGRVVRKDGGPLPGFLKVELVCSGQIRKQVETTIGGRFSIEFGAQRLGTRADASVGPETRGFPSDDGLGWTDLSGCTIRLQRVRGFSSNTIVLTSRSVFDNPEVGVIVLSPLPQFRGTSVNVSLFFGPFNASTLAAPEKARKSYEKAGAELAKEKVNYSKAIQELRKAIKLYPSFAAAWDLLGHTQLKLGENTAARESFEQAIAADPDYVSPFLGLTRLELGEKHWQTAAELSEQIMRLNPAMPQGLYWYGLAKFFLQNFEEAEKSFQNLRDQGQAQHYPGSFLYLGMIHSQAGAIPSAAEEFRQFLTAIPEDRIFKEQGDRIRSLLEEWEKKGIIESHTP